MTSTKYIFWVFLFFSSFASSCSNQPTKISGVKETIEVSYVHLACDCANFIETKFYKHNTDYETREEDCIFIEPSNIKNKIPDLFFEKKHFGNYLKLTGQFYLDKGVPDSYERQMGSPDKAKVFRYDSFKLVKK
jgi:hypothetical protein